MSLFILYSICATYLTLSNSFLIYIKTHITNSFLKKFPPISDDRWELSLIFDYLSSMISIIILAPNLKLP